MARETLTPKPQKKSGIVVPSASDMRRRTAQLNRWRDSYNPLRALTLIRVVSLLEQGQRGDLADLQWAYRAIERRDPVLQAIIQRRAGALCEMDWQVKPVAQERAGRMFDQVLADEQAAALTERYNALRNLYAAVRHLSSATFREFAHVQLQGDSFVALPQWNVVRDGYDGDFYYNPEARSGTIAMAGEENRLDPVRDSMLVRIVSHPVDEIGLIKFARQSLCEKDWDAFVEIYGIPGWIIIMPDNIDPDRESEYRAAAQSVAEGGSGALPNGSDAKCSDAPRGTIPFQQRSEWLDQRLVLAGTGGLLTMLAESGSGTLAGGAHMEAFKTLARSDAREISEIFQQGIDIPFLAERFPGRPVLAYWELSAKEEQDIGATITQVATLATFFDLDPAEVSERTGFTVRTKAAIPPAGIPGRTFNCAPAPTRRVVCINREPPPANTGPDASSGAARLAAAAEADYAPIKARLETILAMEDPAEQGSALEKLKADLPDYLKELTAKPSELAEALNAEMIEAADSAIRQREAATKDTQP